MTIEIVLFEDHTWKGLRPLSAGLPTYEHRCGMFNTRERWEAIGATGRLLCRRLLEPLHGEVAWTIGAADPAAAGGERGGRLWVSGRLAPRTQLMQALVSVADQEFAFAWHDGDGLVAGFLPPSLEAKALAGWRSWRDGTQARWDGPDFGPDAAECRGAHAGRLTCPASAGPGAAARVLATLEEACGIEPPALRRSWDIVAATASALRSDLQSALVAGGWQRHPFGLFAAEGVAAPWRERSLAVRRGQPDLPPGVWLLGDDLWCAGAVSFAPGAVIDTRGGPVIIDQGCEIASHTLMEGPLYLGPASRVKAGARIYGESSFGVGNRLAGEIGESTFGDFANKQHEGFIGHAVLGSWTNLGAMTTCSDLKNNYGPVRVDLGDGPEDTGQRFIGFLAGDHVKTAIGTLLNTGSCVGFASNLFGPGMPPKQVPAFSWGGGAGAPPHGVDEAAATAAVVMGRRGCRFLPAHRALFGAIAADARPGRS